MLRTLWNELWCLPGFEVRLWAVVANVPQRLLYSNAAEGWALLASDPRALGTGGGGSCLVINRSAKAVPLESWVTALISCETLGKNWKKVLKNSGVKMRNRFFAEIRCTSGQCFYSGYWCYNSSVCCVKAVKTEFLHLFVFLPVDVRSWQVPPKSQEATRLCSQGLLGSTGKTEFSQKNSLSVLPL